MNKVDQQTYDRPREKVKAKGVGILSDIELLQLMIGSGTGRMPAVKIAKRTRQVLKRHGSGVTYDQLAAINGLGPARTSQMLAMFELASRYPVQKRQVILNTGDARQQQLLKDKPSISELGYITLDGAGRLIR